MQDIDNTAPITADEAKELAENCTWEDLSPRATSVREKRFGQRVSVCGILNAKSGSCDMDCHFCSQSSLSGKEIPHYPLVPPEKIAAALACAEGYGAGRLGIVTSGGRLSGSDVKRLRETLERLAPGTGVRICASLGRLGRDDLGALKQAGLTRIHHNLETSRSFYSTICSTQSWDSRLETIDEALSLGFEVCAGGLFGLGESWSDRISLALTLRSRSIRNVPINFLIPHEGTPFAMRPSLEADEALKIIALYRLLLPDATLRICGGRKAVLGEKQHLIFRCGANALMTGDYLTAAGNPPEEDLRMIEEQGLYISE